MELKKELHWKVQENPQAQTGLGFDVPSTVSNSGSRGEFGRAY